MADASYLAEMRRLKFNWAKNMNPLNGTIEGWARLAEGWELGVVIAAVDRCITSETVEPKGFADFAVKYLPPKREDAPSTAWWGEDGGWGGDWSRVPRSRVLAVAAILWVGMRETEVLVQDAPVRIDGEWVYPSRKEVRPSPMGEGAKARCGEFLAMAYRRRSEPITEGDVLQAAHALNEGGQAALAAHCGDPSGHAEARRGRMRIAEGVRALREAGIGSGRLPFRRSA